MTRTMRSAQLGRNQERDARLARARERRLALDKDREARDARIDQAMADVYLAHDERAAATAAIAAAELKAAEAIRRLMAEGLALAQVAELTELSSNQVQRLRSAAGVATGPAHEPKGTTDLEPPAG